MADLKPNEGKKLAIDTPSGCFIRLPIRTHLITPKDNIIDTVEKYTRPYWQEGDILFISERIVAISQGRSFFIKDIDPSALAKFLVKFVHKSPYGIGLGSPWTMELALREAGIGRILLAAFLAALTKPLGIKGLFYKVAGRNVNAIDGPCSYTLSPYNQCAKLGPKDPTAVARQIKQQTGFVSVIIDANDLGVAVLGKSDSEISDKFCREVFRDNPLGQTTEQTPLCLVRKIVK